MGKGDKRTKKGKRVMGSYGVSRPSRPHQSNKKTDKKADDTKSEKAPEKEEA